MHLFKWWLKVACWIKKYGTEKQKRDSGFGNFIGAEARFFAGRKKGAVLFGKNGSLQVFRRNTRPAFQSSGADFKGTPTSGLISPEVRRGYSN